MATGLNKFFLGNIEAKLLSTADTACCSRRIYSSVVCEVLEIEDVQEPVLLHLVAI
jgi:hypothetical protein